MNSIQSQFYCLCRNVNVRFIGSKSDVITSTSNLFNGNEKSIHDINKKGEKSPPISSSVTNGESDTDINNINSISSTPTTTTTTTLNNSIMNSRNAKKPKVISVNDMRWLLSTGNFDSKSFCSAELSMAGITIAQKSLIETRSINQEKKDKKTFVWQITNCQNCGLDVCIVSDKRPGYVILNNDISQLPLEECVSNLGKLTSTTNNTKFFISPQKSQIPSSPSSTTTNQNVQTSPQSTNNNITPKGRSRTSSKSSSPTPNQNQSQNLISNKKFVYSELYHVILQDEEVGKNNKLTPPNEAVPESVSMYNSIQEDLAKHLKKEKEEMNKRIQEFIKQEELKLKQNEEKAQKETRLFWNSVCSHRQNWTRSTQTSKPILNNSFSSHAKIPLAEPIKITKFSEITIHDDYFDADDQQKSNSRPNSKRDDAPPFIPFDISKPQPAGQSDKSNVFELEEDENEAIQIRNLKQQQEEEKQRAARLQKDVTSESENENAIRRPRIISIHEEDSDEEEQEKEVEKEPEIKLGPRAGRKDNSMIDLTGKSLPLAIPSFGGRSVSNFAKRLGNNNKKLDPEQVLSLKFQGEDFPKQKNEEIFDVPKSYNRRVVAFE